jgi:hypothetical protein
MRYGVYSNPLCAPIFTCSFGHIGAGDVLARWIHCGRPRECCTEPEVLDERMLAHGVGTECCRCVGKLQFVFRSFELSGIAVFIPQ